MTITFSSIWIPFILTCMLSLFGINNLKDSTNHYIGDFGAILLSVIVFGGILIVWTHTMLCYTS